MELVTPYYRDISSTHIPVQTRKIEDTAFSPKDIKRTRKILKKNGVPKEYWFIDILDQETNETVRFKL